MTVASRLGLTDHVYPELRPPQNNAPAIHGNNFARFSLFEDHQGFYPASHATDCLAFLPAHAGLKPKRSAGQEYSREVPRLV
jgi:hypothetical protein